MKESIAIIGCGNIGLSIANGLIQDNWEGNLYLTRRNSDSLSELTSEKVHVSGDNNFAVQSAKYIILGLKPYKIEEIVRELSPLLTEEHVLISVASGVSIEALKTASGNKCAVVRAMPNTGAAIQESMTCICGDVDPNKREKVNEIFKAIGPTIWIEESLMEAATILGACGIAYVLRFIRAMIQGGIQIGFDAKTAAAITTQTVKGAAELLIEKKTHPESEIDKVTTPKGCTITGLNEMEHKGFSSALIHGIVESYKQI